MPAPVSTHLFECPNGQEVKIEVDILNKRVWVTGARVVTAIQQFVYREGSSDLTVHHDTPAAEIDALCVGIHLHQEWVECTMDRSKDPRFGSMNRPSLRASIFPRPISGVPQPSIVTSLSTGFGFLTGLALPLAMPKEATQVIVESAPA